LIFLIDWPEPFGLSMIEAMACGTPVLAFRRGSVEEIVENGLTGYIANDMPDAAEAFARVTVLDRRAVRKRFEQRFSAARMAKDYVRVYKLLQTKERPASRRSQQPAIPEYGNEQGEPVH